MKLIIAGGRSYTFTQKDFERLDAIHEKFGVAEVVCGTPWDPKKKKPPVGADQWGAFWANERGIPVKDMPAEWDNIARPGAIIRYRRDGTPYDVVAGPYRNGRMAEYGDAAALFPGGTGTASMYREAQKAGIQIFDYRE